MDNKFSKLILSTTICGMLAGCGKKGGGDQTSAPPPQPSTSQDQTRSQPPADTNDESRSHANGQREAGSASSPVIYPNAWPYPPITQQTQTDASAPWQERIRQSWDNTKNYFNDKLNAFSGLISPSENRDDRAKSFAATHEQSQEVRDQNLTELKKEALASSAAPMNIVYSTLHPSDEVTTLLVALVSETDPIRIDRTSAELIDEVFNEPDMARAKIMEIQLSLRRLAEQNLYDTDLSKRVAYLQANLDARVRSDQTTDILRDGLLIAGTSMALGTVAGFHGFDRVREVVHEYPGIRSSLNAGREQVKSWGSRASQKIKSVFGRAGEDGTGGGVFRRLPPEDVATRNLRAVGLDESVVQSLDLTPAQSHEINYYDFKPTNLPGFRYAVADKWDGADLEGDRMIIFSLPRAGVFKSRPPVVSRKLSAYEAQKIVDEIEFRSQQEGGRTFAAIVDGETGEVTATRIPASDLTVEIDEIHPHPLAETNPSRISVAEAQAEGAIPHDYGQTPAEDTVSSGPGEEQASTHSRLTQGMTNLKNKVVNGAQEVAANTKNAASTVAEGAKSAAQRVASKSKQVIDQSVRPAWSKFDGRWAAAVTALSAAPAYGLYYAAYDEGHSHGENYNTVYLESLIPYERLNEVSMVFDDSSQANGAVK